MPSTRRSRTETLPKPAITEENATNNGTLSLNAIRKVTRSSSNLSGNAGATPKKAPKKSAVTALFQGKLLVFRGLPTDFLSELEDVEAPAGSLVFDVLRDVATNNKAGTAGDSAAAADDDDDDDDDSDESDTQNESDDSLHAPLKASRGRGGRGRGRVKSARRGRGRFRGVVKEEISTPRKRALREAAPKDLTELPDELESAQASGVEDAKSTESVTREEENAAANEDSQEEHPPIPEIVTTEAQDGDDEPEVDVIAEIPAQSIEKPSPMRPSITRQNSNASALRSVPASKAPSEAPKIRDEDLMDLDLPAPFIENCEKPKREDCEDEADYIMKSKFKPMTDPQFFIELLTRYSPAERSTEVLYAIAESAQKALEAWQDEYIKLDAMTASKLNPPKKPATGGRQPVDNAVYESMKEADLYDYIYDPKKPPSLQDPWSQRLGRDANGGRELRTRRQRDAVGSTQVSEEDEDGEGVGKRRRRAAQRFEGTATPEVGTRGTRKRGTGQEGDTDQGDLERSIKRARTTGSSLNPRIREIRGESVLQSSTEAEGSPEPGSKRRGRPPGSKNLQRRSDAGIKKGPRKPATTKPPQIPETAQEGNPTAAAPGVRFAVDDGQSTQKGATAPTNDTSNAQPTSSANAKVPIPAQPADADGNPGERKQRAKSEKRSDSMKKWWDERKSKKQAERLAEEKRQQKDAMASYDSRQPIAPSGPPPKQQQLPAYPAVAQSMNHSGAPPVGPPSYPLTGHMPPQQMLPQPPPPHLQQHPHQPQHPQFVGGPPPIMRGPYHHAPPGGPPPVYYHHPPPPPGAFIIHPNQTHGPPPGPPQPTTGVPSPYPPPGQGQAHFRPRSRG